MLQESRNPFAVVVMAHLKALETAGKPEARHRWKFELVKGLYGRGFSREDVLELLRFIDWVMVLPRELECQFREDMDNLEKEKRMPYVTSWERDGIEKGRAQGIRQGVRQGIREGQQQLLVRLIRARFGEELAAEGEESLARLKRPAQLAQVGDWLVQCATGAELLRRLREAATPPAKRAVSRSNRSSRTRRTSGAKSK
ncbi:MAG: hypothetical protein HY814_04540 [Candidatus Riflebacteria bacterium]|nr:hypothetical protein [Candidatus Riflebacteria bacterium]